MVVEYGIKLIHRGKEISANACLTNKVLFNSITETLFRESFGEVWNKLKKPYEMIVKGQRVMIDKYAILTVVMGPKTFEAEFYITNALLTLFETKCEVIIGKKSLEANKIRIIEEE